MAYQQPTNPHILTYDEVVEARDTIRDGVKRTACERSDSLSTKYEIEVYLKLEIQQSTGSFKVRGALSALRQLPEEVKRNGVITASGGNFAMALAYHRGSIPVTVVMPVTTPLNKRNFCREYGATVVIKGAHLKESQDEAYRLKALDPCDPRYISGFDYPDAIAGYGTVGLEIMEQVEEVDAVIVSVGGAGLIAGISTAVKEHDPKTKVIGVELTRCASYSEASQHSSPHDPVRPGSSSLADGLVVPMVGENAFATASRLVDRIEQVDERCIAQAILHLAEKEKCIVEGAGAAGVAALIQDSLNYLQGKKVVIVIGGGNIDMTTLGRSLERGLAADGRLFRISVIVRDRPGGIAELTQIIKDRDINIRDMTFERAWLQEDVHSVRVHCVMETRDRQQAHDLYEELRRGEQYCQVTWVNESLTSSPKSVKNGE